MTVFKTFLKVLNKNKFIIIIYTVILLIFGASNMQTKDNSIDFVATEPDVFIVNHDDEKGITKDFIQYIKKNCHLVSLKQGEYTLDDALFYRDVNYIIYIPEHFNEDFFAGRKPEIQVKSTGDYQASLVSMMVERYLKVANVYLKTSSTEEEFIKRVNDTLSKQVTTRVTSTIDTEKLDNVAFFYNFTNYSLLAGCVYVICIILSSFKSEKIKKRTMISSMNYKEYNRKLLYSNSLFAFVLWLFYVLLSFVLLGDIMFTLHGWVFILNSFVFMICTVTLAFLIGNIVHDKNALNGIVNVIALGSSFLCGAFVPMEWLPDVVIKIAHLLPSYYYIRSNDILTGIETFNMTTMRPIITNMIILLLFAVGFVIITNLVSKRERKIG